MKRIGRSVFLTIVLLFPAALLAQGTSIRVVVLGSSTAEGCCAPKGQGWVDRYRDYLATTGRPTEVINLGVGGFTTFEVLPSDYVSPYRSLRTDWNIAPNPNYNITKALSYNPTHIIINLPSNDADLGVPVAYQLVHYDEMLARARAQGVPVWITTTQPRDLPEAGRRLLMEMRDSTFSRFKEYAIDFWNGIANADGTIAAAYNYDGTHLNADGHAILYERVRARIPLNPVTPPAPTNILANGGFEAGTTSWSFYTNGSGTFASVAGGTEGTKSVKIAITREGTNVQLNQTNVVLDQNTKYQLSFDAYCKSGHDLSLSLVQSVFPYKNYGLSSMKFDLGTGWQHHTVAFTTGALGGTVKDGRLMFSLAAYDAAGDEYYFDNVVLAKGDAPAAVAPTITVHPTNQTVSAGQTATFSVTATGTAPLQYQWQKNSVDVSGATAASYTTPAVASTDNGATYRVIVSNNVGGVTSNAATLTVSSSSTPPPSTANVLANGGFEGGTASWFFYSNGSGTFASVAGGTEGTMTAKIGISVEGTNVQLHQTGVTLDPSTKYQLSFDAYCTSGHDLSVSLVQNVSPYTNYGLSSVAFDLGTGWQRYTVTFTTGAFGGRVTDGRLMFWLAPYDAAGDEYYVDNVVLTKGDAPASAGPTITAHPANQTVSVGQTATFSVTATGTAPLQYQWQKNSTSISGATGSSYTTPAVASTDNGATYRVIVSNSVGNVTSNAATLTVSSSSTPPPSAANILANGGFEGGTTSWFFYSNGSGTFASVAGGTEGTKTAKVAIAVEGTNVQLHQTGVTLGSNTKYQLSFDAYCTSGHDLSVSLVQNVSPYTNYGLSSMAFDLGTGWQHYTVTFTTSALGGTVTDGRLMFWFAPYDAAGDEYYVDNVVLSNASSTVAAGPTAETQTAEDLLADGATEILPTQLQLHQNFPNPFNPSTTIGFDLPQQGYVRVKIYDVLGRELVTLLEGERNAGTYRLHWDARDVSSGVYFCRLQVEPAGSENAGTVLSRKLILSK